MKKALVLVVLAMLVVALPASAARLEAPPVDHGTVYLQSTYCLNTVAGAGCFAGAAVGDGTVGAVPGVLCIDPGVNAEGTTDWHNFVSVATVPESLTGGWFIKNVVLRKEIPAVGQCFDVYSTGPNYPAFNQQGSINIRTWWPLMYEAPGTKWILTVTAGTKKLYNGAYIHQDIWTWEVATSLEAIKCELDLFNSLAWGLCEIPLISNRAFYADLQAQVDQVILYNSTDKVLAAEALIEFENMVMEACNSSCPTWAPAGFVGIVQTLENPVCCKLIVDAERAGWDNGIFTTKK